MSAGIDYGMGQANIDTATGIRYGVISPHSVNPDAYENIRSNGDNLSYKAAVEEAQASIAGALEDVLDDMGALPYVSKYVPTKTDKARRDKALAGVVESVWNEVEQDWNDRYEEDNDTYRYEQDGYVLETSSLGVYVIRSPFYTFARFCSPCCPGAGNLDSPDTDGVKTYCLGADWFDDDNPCPYRVFNVADDSEVAS